VTSGEIGSIVECYDGDPEKTARELVEAANRAGGSDNVTAIFVPEVNLWARALRNDRGARAACHNQGTTVVW